MDGESRSREFCVTANWRLSESLPNFMKECRVSRSAPLFGARSFDLVCILSGLPEGASGGYELR